MKFGIKELGLVAIVVLVAMVLEDWLKSLNTGWVLYYGVPVIASGLIAWLYYKIIKK